MLNSIEFFEEFGKVKKDFFDEILQKDMSWDKFHGDLFFLAEI